VFIQQLWRDRLRGVQRHVEVWQSLFSIRSLVVPMAQVRAKAVTILTNAEQ
jgi:FKBP12-rapamycin complex-associated protein